jgi:hypothetical protein
MIDSATPRVVSCAPREEPAPKHEFVAICVSLRNLSVPVGGACKTTNADVDAGRSTLERPSAGPRDGSESATKVDGIPVTSTNDLSISSKNTPQRVD